ncbi:MAG TPA: hypothetical protein VIP46_16155 [Pyrinomonadaceae bacterium]
MVVIGFSDQPEGIWCVAGWVFRLLRGDVITQYPEDKEMADAFASAEIFSGLHVDSLTPELAVRVADALRQVTSGILSGAIRSGIRDLPFGDATAEEQYQQALRELLNILPPT